MGRGEVVVAGERSDRLLHVRGQARTVGGGGGGGGVQRRHTGVETG